MSDRMSETNYCRCGDEWPCRNPHCRFGAVNQTQLERLLQIVKDGAVKAGVDREEESEMERARR